MPKCNLQPRILTCNYVIFIERFFFHLREWDNLGMHSLRVSEPCASRLRSEPYTPIYCCLTCSFQSISGYFPLFLLIVLMIRIKNNIIITIRTFPACFAPEKFSMLNNLVNLWSKRMQYHVIFTPARKLSLTSMLG